MLKHPAFTPGFLSLLLPGLGQLYEKRFLPAALFFAAFAAFDFIPSIRFLLPVAALFAGLEAFTWAKRNSPTVASAPKSEPRYRWYSYVAVGVAGCMAWFLNIAPGLLPFGNAMQVSADATDITRWLRSCETTPDCGHRTVPVTNDPWGSPYQYSHSGTSIEVRSAGPDRTFQTADDFSYVVQR